ncbi:monovalent cation/H(+) antiporter subunit G [Jonesia quinghaiensis]|uniref:monovalent cation/H(+) antiporter subunit G n=1 Tax=Jonesia quinghaiensis TaxID=262806 RepID=UPI00056BEB88|nr:monovalent cation/H(+) antiporter subunit G [Jonesia quinghaiensis]
MMLGLVADVLAVVCLLLGAFLTFAAGIGVLRFPDLLMRMHAATKPQVLGLILMLTAEALRVRSWGVVGLLALIIIFQLFTAPVAAHMVGRAGYRTGQYNRDLLERDELHDDLQQASKDVQNRKSSP